MFTDIAGFTSHAEGRPAQEVAEFLNNHFALLADSIEAEGGTVDKFIGDAVMAFWGAPEAQADHAERACRAALSIVDAVHADNQRRQAEGQPAIRVRVGLHSGPVIVGNIGAPGRINYTIVGDTVNTCQRLEQLGKTAGPRDAEVVVLVSAATAALVGPGFTLVRAGKHQVPGRRGRVEIFRLERG